MLAVGRDFSDVSPVDGIIVGSRKQKLARGGGRAAGGVDRTIAFSSEACPGLDPGWIPVRVKKTRQNKNL